MRRRPHCDSHSVAKVPLQLLLEQVRLQFCRNVCNVMFIAHRGAGSLFHVEHSEGPLIEISPSSWDHQIVGRDRVQPLTTFCQAID